MGKEQIVILGAGAWGTTLGWVWASSGQNVTLWTCSSEQAEQLRTTRKMEQPHPITLPENISISDNLEAALQQASIVVMAVSSQAVREVASSAAPHVKPSVPIVNASKGLELSSLKTLSTVISECIKDSPIVALSGPNLAAEVARGLPAATVLACADQKCGERLQKVFSTPLFRVYLSDDIVGVELGGALKNIIAIATGINDGLGLGINSRSALMTRGLAEINRLAIAMGAKQTTLNGLSGMGDLITTCTSPLSRNYRLGLGLTQGLSLDNALKQLGGVAEGVPTCEAACKLSKEHKIEMPLTHQIEDILKGKITPQDAIMKLMGRPLVKE